MDGISFVSACVAPSIFSINIKSMVLKAAEARLSQCQHLSNHKREMSREICSIGVVVVGAWFMTCCCHTVQVEFGERYIEDGDTIFLHCHRAMLGKDVCLKTYVQCATS